MPWLVPNERFEREGTLPIVVRFRQAPTGEELRALEAAGASFGSPPEITYAGTFLGRTTEAGLKALEHDANVERLTSDLAVRAPLPVEASSRVETHVDRAVRALRAKDGTVLDGTGATILDIDSGVFIFHPALFRADGGYSAWIDVDGNGQFDVGVDGVDLDGDGAVAEEEVLHRLSADIRSARLQRLESSKTFRSDEDFLYCDTNGNGKRDYGEGFDEETPAYGEPLFVLDDADADGVVALSEKVVRLKTSKIKKLRSGTKTYTRGGTGASALIQYAAKASAEEIEDMMHGTGVAGILVGGTPGISRWVGLAPNADLVVGAYGESASALVNWGLKQKPDVALTEYAPYTTATLDGSSEEDAMFDAALAKGTVTVSPAGNLASSGKHASKVFVPGANTFEVKTDKRFTRSRYLALSMRSKGLAQRMLELQLRLPDGSTVNVTKDQELPLSEGLELYVQARTTSRGTFEKDIILYSPSKPLAAGPYGFEAVLDDGESVPVEMYVADDANSWLGGPYFDQATPRTTLCAPSTGDTTITVAAYVLNSGDDYGADGEAGELAGYSSRGPRIDGVPKVGVAAPDNPMSLCPPVRDVGANGYMPFGGTSGAGPHVAAAVALLRQLFPEATASELRERILSSARRDAHVTSDATQWGAGKLDAAGAMGLEIADGPPPTITLVAPAEAPAEDHAPLSVEIVDAKSEAYKARWDFDYDGVPDTDWAPLAEVQAPTGPEGTHQFVKVEIMDANGNVAADTAILAIGPKAPVPAADPATATTSTTEEGCGCATVGSSAVLSRDATKMGGLALAFGAWFVRRRRRQGSPS